MLPLVSLSSPLWWLPALPLLYCLAGTSATNCKSIAEKGVITCFGTPPVNKIALETLVVEPPAPQSDALEQPWLEEIRETTDSMVTNLMAKEKHRAEVQLGQP
ncbi:MAG: hypothetical protein P8J17_05540 [Halioglobus sp.]|nr:hypothetical protein [Halioglobus sp.]